MTELLVDGTYHGVAYRAGDQVPAEAAQFIHTLAWLFEWHQGPGVDGPYHQAALRASGRAEAP